MTLRTNRLAAIPTSHVEAPADLQYDETKYISDKRPAALLKYIANLAS